MTIVLITYAYLSVYRSCLTHVYDCWGELAELALALIFYMSSGFYLNIFLVPYIDITYNLVFKY